MQVRGVFTARIREQRDLSSLLWALPSIRALVESIRGSRSELALAAFRGERLDDLIRSVRLTPPVVASAPATPEAVEGGGEWRQNPQGVKIPTSRYVFRYQVTGEATLLAAWPDQSEDIRAIDDDLLSRYGGREGIPRNSADEDEFWRLSGLWTVESWNGTPCLRTSIDLTPDEELLAIADRSLQGYIDNSRAAVQPIIQAIHDQSSRFFATDLPDALRVEVTRREGELARKAAVVATVEIADEWTPEVPELEIASCMVPDERPGQTPLELPITAPRLAPKSFSDIQTIIRVWADAVEQNPRGFANLNEDALSDLLCATLNATVANAQREVYSRSGKTDILIRADTLREGTGQAAVFICEAKWARRKKLVHEALQEQLFRYATSSINSTVLLALCSQKDFPRARNQVRVWASSVDEYVSERQGAVEGWPILRYRAPSGVLDVVVATIHLRMPDMRAAIS